MFSILLVIVLSAGSGMAIETADFNAPNVPIEQLAEAYGFALGQEYTLQLIKQELPDLAGQVNQARFVFEKSVFAQGFSSAEVMLATTLGDKWPELQIKTVEQIGRLIESHEITREEAIGFLAEVKERATGVLPDRIRATLLSVHPQYSRNPSREFLDGWKQTFDTKGHEKSKGVNFRFAYPASWTRVEGDRPNIVQTFRSKGGHGLETAMIITKELPVLLGSQISPENLKDFFSSPALRDMVPTSATVLDTQATEIEHTPAGILEYTVTRERLGTIALMHVWAVTFIYDNTLVLVQFSVGGPADTKADISQRMAMYKPLFRQMANSIVLPGKWTARSGVSIPTATKDSTMNTLHSLDDGSLSFLISAFVITWIVALTPPLVIRYAIARHPLSKRAASWIAAGWCGALWIADQILIHSEGGQAGKITAIYIVMFGVTRWVMNRGHTGPSSIHVETSPTNLNDSVQFDSSQRQQSAC